jgi:dual specificity tyrosine-phosphorylation-regulated kinase 2/3/4
MFANLRTIQIFARQILIALQKLHELHIAHTDLKPENILIKSYTNRTLKVIDVGSSVFFHD